MLAGLGDLTELASLGDLTLAGLGDLMGLAGKGDLTRSLAFAAAGWGDFRVEVSVSLRGVRPIIVNKELNGVNRTC